MLKTNKFIIPFEYIPSYNSLMRKHWFRKNELRDMVYTIMMTQLRGKVRMERCTIQLVAYLCHLRDEDGLNSGLKYPIDYLVIKNLIPDDSPEYVTVLRAKQIKIKPMKDRRFEIIMKEREWIGS